LFREIRGLRGMFVARSIRLLQFARQIITFCNGLLPEASRTGEVLIKQLDLAPKFRRSPCFVVQLGAGGTKFTIDPGNPRGCHLQRFLGQCKTRESLIPLLFEQWCKSLRASARSRVICSILAFAVSSRPVRFVVFAESSSARTRQIAAWRTGHLPALRASFSSSEGFQPLYGVRQ
jgi:hypothetical protein